MQPKVLGWQPIVTSWLNQLPQAFKAHHKETLRRLCEWLVGPCLRAVRKDCNSYVPIQDINLVVSLCTLTQSLLWKWTEVRTPTLT